METFEVKDHLESRNSIYAPTTTTEISIRVQDDEATYAINCCCGCGCIRNDEVSTAKHDLFSLSFDWIIDAALGTYHILRGNLIAGILTYFIVIQAGVVITFTNFSPKQCRCNATKIKSQIWKMSKFYGGLMYIPSFFPICSAKLRLSVAKQLKKSKDPGEREELKSRLDIIKEKAVWDSCCESFLESFPQAVLQIIMILQPTKSYAGFIDYLPIIPVFIALYGITNAPIGVMEVRKTGNLLCFQKMTAYAANSLRVYSSGLFVLSVLRYTTMSGDHNKLMDVLWISLSALAIFFLLGGPYIIHYELIKIHPEYSKAFLAILNALSFLICLASFYFWVISQILPFPGNFTIKTCIVISTYSLFVFLTSVGILCYRDKLEVYNNVSSEVVVQIYDGFKSWIRIRICCCFWSKGSTIEDDCKVDPVINASSVIS